MSFSKWPRLKSDMLAIERAIEDKQNELQTLESKVYRFCLFFAYISSEDIFPRSLLDSSSSFGIFDFFFVVVVSLPS